MHLNVFLGAGTLQLKNHRLIGFLKTTFCSARPTQYSVLGSAEKVQILT